MPYVTMTGTMARRMLVNWRIEPEAARRVLPGVVRPKLVDGYAIAGLCLVRLERMRLAYWPPWIGLASENVAARMGIEWDSPTGLRQGVLIFRRDTASRSNAFFGPHFGYGVHSPAAISVNTAPGRIDIAMASGDGFHTADLSASDAPAIMPGSLFGTLEQAATFFRGGECGYSPTDRPGHWHGVGLRLGRWDLVPMAIRRARSSWIESWFGAAATLDSAFIMRNIEHTWRHIGSEEWGVAPPLSVPPARGVPIRQGVAL